MAVTAEQYRAMSREPYSKARERLQTGDILLFSSHSLFSSVIEAATHSPWSHSALVWRAGGSDRILLLESIENIGIRAISARTSINGVGPKPKPYTGGLLAVRHRRLRDPLPSEMEAKLLRFGIDHLGDPYSAMELARIAARVTLGLVGIELPGELQPTHGYICSEFVAECYGAIGIHLAPDIEGFMAPADIANDPEIEAVVALRPDDVKKAPR